MNGLSAVFLMLASTASAVAPPIWDAHDRLLCQETFTLRCEIGNFQECERGELGLVVILDFKSNLVKERFLSDSDDEIIGRVYRPTIGTYADSIIITEHGDMKAERLLGPIQQIKGLRALKRGTTALQFTSN